MTPNLKGTISARICRFSNSSISAGRTSCSSHTQTVPHDERRRTTKRRDNGRRRFNSGVSYKGRVLKWDTVIEQKTMELARYLTGKSKLLDLSGPKPEFDRTDSLELRKRILSVSQSEMKRIGISKSTFHYLRKNVEGNMPFRVYTKTQEKLSLLE